jgi:uncharacterized protein YaiI (UPF0178 family)
MQIWVDADGCPTEIKELLYRVAERRKILVTFVANQPRRTPASPFITSVRVGEGVNVADRYIIGVVAPGDLVITADIPFAAEVVSRGAQLSIPAATCTPMRMLASDSPPGICWMDCAARA